MSRPTNEPPFSDESGEALEFAALLGEEFEIELILALGIKPEALDPLFDGGIFRESEGGEGAAATFADEAYRLEVAEGIAWSRRRQLHRRIAEALRDRRLPFVEVAEHFRKGHEYGEARKYFIRAAEAACEENRYGEAFAALKAGMELWPASEDVADRRRVLREMARCARNCGELAEARGAWAELLEAAEGEVESGEAVLEAHRQLADLESMAGNFVMVKNHLYAAAECCEALGAETESAQQWFAVSVFLTDRIRLRDALDAVHRAREKAEQAGAFSLLSECIGWEGLVMAMMGRAGEAQALVDESLKLAVRHELTEQVAIAYRRSANICDYAANYAGERDAHLHAIQVCRAQGERVGEQTCLSCLSYAFFRTGEWKRALETAKGVLDDEEAHGALKAIALTVTALVAVFRGETRRAGALVEESLLDARRHGVVGMEFFALWAAAILAESAGEEERAGALYREIKLLWRDTEDRHDAVPGLVSAAAFFADLNEADEVGECCDILNAICRENDNDETRAGRQAGLAEHHWVGGKLPSAIEAMSEACAGYGRLGTPLEEGLAWRRLGRLHAMAGDWEKAEAARGSAAGIAKRAGLRPLLDGLDRDRAQAGATGERSGGAGASLTPRQRDVLRLIATGLTNKEAAEQLNLSPRTVEMHVAKALERLNCRTRTEAIRRAAESGLLE
jgi:DNA-binding CsgD family transcriptional regulator